jgi:diazepam-binding inhibitor (GABA receptor modulating acyl-CoA-binding protein)
MLYGSKNLHSQLKQMLTMDVKVLFDQATEESQNLSERPSNETLLQLYGLYKQSTEGDINVDPPSNPFDFVSRAKYDAWLNLKGKSKEAAMKEYVELINKLKT